jgi:hypothetical protein
MQVVAGDYLAAGISVLGSIYFIHDGFTTFDGSPTRKRNLQQK